MIASQPTDWRVVLEVSEWRTFGTVDWTAARHFTRLLARQVLDHGMPEGVSVLNLNVSRDATTRTELRRTVQSQQPSRWPAPGSPACPPTGGRRWPGWS